MNDHAVGVAWLRKHGFEVYHEDDPERYAACVQCFGGRIWFSPAEDAKIQLELPMERIFLSDTCEIGNVEEGVTCHDNAILLGMQCQVARFSRSSIAFEIELGPAAQQLFRILATLQQNRGHHSPCSASAFGVWRVLAHPLELRKRPLTGEQEAVLDDAAREKERGIEVVRWRVARLLWEPSELALGVLEIGAGTMRDLVSEPTLKTAEEAVRYGSLGDVTIAEIEAAIRGDDAPIIAPIIDMAPSGASEGMRWWQCRRCRTYLDLLDDANMVLASPDRAACPKCGADDPMTVEPPDDPFFDPRYEKVKALVRPPLDDQMLGCIKEAKALIDEAGIFPEIMEDKDPTPAWARGVVVAVLAVGLRGVLRNREQDEKLNRELDWR